VREIPCHKVASGYASGPAMVTKMAISFLGNVDPRTGIVVDPGHELYGESISGKVLIFPGGKGSTVGSYVIYQLKKKDLAPAAMINLRSEPIVAVGAIISGIPLVDRVPSDILQLKNGSCIEVDSDRERIRILP
jgi:predicted aconitase with swiveling domain